MAKNVLEYVMQLDSGLFDGPLKKARAGLRGAKGDAQSLSSTLGQMGNQTGGSAGLGGVLVGMTALQVAAQRTEPLYKRLFNGMETGIGRVARGLRIGGGVTQIGSLFLRQLPGMERFRAGLAATEARAARFNSRLETLAGMGGKDSGGFGMRIMGGARGGRTSPVSAAMPTLGGGSAAAAGGIGLTGLLRGGAAAGMLAGAVGGVGASNKAADFESTEIAFKNLIGDASLAKKTLKDLFDFAAATPFEMPEVQLAAVKLQAAGVSADKLTGSLRVLGNITSAYQANLGAISTIFAQVVNKGQLYAEEIQQFGENGVPALRLLAEESGKTTAEIMEMASDGKLSAQDLARAFDRAGGAGGKFGAAMKEQAMSTKGLWSTLRDTINQALTKLGTPVNSWLKPWLQEGISWVGRFGNALAVAVSIGQRAAAEGKLGELLSASVRSGLSEILIMGGEVAGELMRSLGRAVNFFTVGDVEKVGGGISQALTGLGKIIRAELGAAFRDVASTFQAALTVAVTYVMEKLGEIPAVGEALGLDGFRAMSFDDAFAEFQAQNDTSGLRKEGESDIRSAFGNPGDDLKKALLGEDWARLSNALKGSLEKAGKDAQASLAQSIGDAAAQGAKDGLSKKVKSDPNSRYDEEGRRRSDGRRQIRGFSRREKGLAGTGGLDEFYANQRAANFNREGIPGFRPGDRFKGPQGGLFRTGDDITTDAATPAGLRRRFGQGLPAAAVPAAGSAPGAPDGDKLPGSTKAVQRRGFSGLAGYDALQKAKESGSRVGDGFKMPSNKQLPSPGAAKAQDQRREAAASQSRDDRARWDVVQKIEQHLGKLVVA